MASKKRLIDANILESWIDGGIQGAEEGQGNAPIVSLYDVLDELNSIPTEEAVEVVHGRWDTVFYERNGTLASYSHICPRCKYFYRDLKSKGHNYCPNCGARMDGE